jgi:hypothetical protein
MRPRIVGLAALSLILAPALGAAQAPPKTTPPVAPKAEAAQEAACAQADTHATVGQGGDVKVPTPEGKDLSQKLAQSNGVICPPSTVDRAMTTPPPKGGAMRVIPPPGTPGSGQPNVQPK